MSRAADLTGRRFGSLTVLERTGQQENRYWTWRCVCDCGKEIVVSTKHLSRGSINSCGCGKKVPTEKMPNDLTGKRYGKLTVLRFDKQLENGKTSWLCQCDCGNQCVVTADSLHHLKRKSCGCLHREVPDGQAADLTDQVFGRLTVLEPADAENNHGARLWRCKCECGNEINVSQERLLQGYSKSCGCLRQERQEKLHENLTLIDNTCIEMLERRKSRADNTSGFRGVSRGRDGKWIVTIGLQSKRYYVGQYVNFDHAVRARLHIEEALHDGFVEAYQTWQGKAEADDAWAKENPFYFHVEKSGSDFRINSVVGSTVVSAL